MGFNLDDYEPVDARIARFYDENPHGTILTELIESGDGEFIVKALVYRFDGEKHTQWASGLAREIVTDRGVNSTSALENCETSAIGRALANAGYAAKGKRPSREEMARVQTITGEQAEALIGMLDELGHYPAAWKKAHMPGRAQMAQLRADQFVDAEAILAAAINDAEPF